MEGIHAICRLGFAKDGGGVATPRWELLYQSSEVEFIRVVGCAMGVMPDEHHHVYWQIDDGAYCLHIPQSGL